jgi:membrane protein required for beta-lactamase induction
MRKRLKWIVPAAIIGIAVFTALGGTVVMLLWNWLLPTLFGLPSITFWQAIGLLALCRMILPEVLSTSEPAALPGDILRR